jgi:hypothetical protein
MGFNQNKIAHDFRSTPTGGEIMITALDTNDTETVTEGVLSVSSCHIMVGMEIQNTVLMQQEVH